MKTWTKYLTLWVLLFGLVGHFLGSNFGDPNWASQSAPPEIYQLILFLKTGFLSILKMMVAPLVFFSLIGGILNIGTIDKLKGMGKITITYYLSTTLIAIMIGLTTVFFIHPWTNIEGQTKNTLTIKKSQEHALSKDRMINKDESGIFVIFKKLAKKSFVNPFNALSNNNILGIVAFALMLGIAILISVPLNSPIITLVEHTNKALSTLLGWIILTAPIGIFAITFDFALKVSGNIYDQLLSFALVVLAGTLVHGFIVLPLIAYFFGKTPPLKLWKAISRPLLIALTTASSQATLPVTMKTCEEELGVDKSVSGFVFPLGATMNMDGTALFEGIAAIFLAHLYGIDLSTFSIISIFIMSMISSIGAPGMPSGSMSGMQMVLIAAGIPLEAIGILMVVERPLDTFRTAVNVKGDIVGALVTQAYYKRVK